MAKNWAIVIGINEYHPINFSPLKYAKRDAELMRDFFREMEFDEVFYFSDDSPKLELANGLTIPTHPSQGNLVSFFEDRFGEKRLKRPPLGAGDNCWFFFAGHGERYADRDYLIPIDGNARGTKQVAAIAVSDIREWLCRSGADNVVLILDACRSEGSRDGQGIGNEHLQGVITIWSCSPTQKSWEIDELQQGAFTYALLEALQISGEGNCATVERLGRYLRDRVPELCQQYRKIPAQNPRISIDPETKYHYLLLPQPEPLKQDIIALKKDAYQAAQVDNNLELAEQLWIRIIAATQGRDIEALRAHQSLKQLSPPPQPVPQHYPVANLGESRSTPESPSAIEPVDDLNPEPPQPQPKSDRDEGRSIPKPPSAVEVTDDKEVVPSNPESLPQHQTKSEQDGKRSTPTAPPPAAESVHQAEPETPPKPIVPWGCIASCLILYGLSGIGLAASSARFWDGVLAWFGAVAWAAVVAWVGAVVEAETEGGAEADDEVGVVSAGVVVAGIVSMLMAMAGGVIAVGMVVVVAVGMAVISYRLLRGFSRSHTFLILTSVSALGLGLGWLLHRVYSLLQV